MIENVPKTRRYTLEITENQAQTLVNALDLYSRIGLGQFLEVASIYAPAHHLSPEEREELELRLTQAKAAVGHPRNGSFGIYCRQVPDGFRLAWDLMKVIRHQLAIDRDPTGTPWRGVSYDEPDQSALEPLAEIRVGGKESR
jgi:hypothetical protein